MGAIETQWILKEYKRPVAGKTFKALVNALKALAKTARWFGRSRSVSINAPLWLDSSRRLYVLVRARIAEQTWYAAIQVTGNEGNFGYPLGGKWHLTWKGALESLHPAPPLKLTIDHEPPILCGACGRPIEECEAGGAEECA